MQNAFDTVDSVTTGLLQDVKEGDTQAWAFLVEMYSPVIFLWCRQRGLSSDQAQDVGQETWTRVWSSVGRFEKETGQHAFRRWLFTIVRNKIIDTQRKRKERALTAPDDVTLPNRTDHEEPPGVELLFTKVVEWISSKYREHNWKAFILCYAEGLDRDEVARSLGLTRNQVDLACSRILRALKEEFRAEIRPE